MHKITILLLTLFSFSAFGQNTVKEPVIILNGHTNDVSAVVFSPSRANVLVSGAWDNLINIYSADSPYALMQTKEGHISAVKTISYNPNGREFASGGNDHLIIIWDSVFNKVKVLDDVIRGHDTKINCLTYDRRGKYLLSGADDGKIVVWNVAAGSIAKSISYGVSINSIATTINPQYIVVAGAEPTIKMISVSNGKIFKSFDGHKDAVNSLAVSPNNRYLLSGSNDKSAKLWDLRTIKEIRTFAVDCWKVTATAFTWDSRFCATACNDGSIKIWEVETGNLITNIEEQGFNIRDISFSIDGKYIAAAPLMRKETDEYGVRVYATLIPEPVKKVRPTNGGYQRNAPRR